MKKLIQLIGMSACIFLFAQNVMGMDGENSSDQKPPKQPRPGMPFSLSFVPFRRGWLSLFNAFSPVGIGRPKFYITAAALAAARNRKKTPATISQMALTDAGYEGVSALFRSAGGNLNRAPQLVKSTALHGSRLAAYALTQETMHRAYPNGADPMYSQNIRYMARNAGEEVATETIWGGTKYASKKTGFTGLLKNYSSKLACALGLNKLPGADVAKPLVPIAVDEVGKAFVRGTVVRPTSDYLFGERYTDKNRPWRFGFGFSIGDGGFKPYIGVSL